MARPSSSERARRLIALLPYLSERGTVRLTTLAERLGTDPEEIAEDIGVLALCGADEYDPASLIGVYVEGDEAEVWADLPALDRPLRLTPSEARALAIALESIGVDPASPLPVRLAKVASQDPDIEGVARTVRATYAPGGHADVIAALTAAIAARRSARIEYHTPSRDEGSARVVHPYALYMWRGVWYLLAFCESAGEERTFRVDRITGVHTTGGSFTPPDTLRSSPEPLPDISSLPRAVVRFASNAPDLNDRDWPGATFEPMEDGSVLGSIPCAGTGWIARKVAARLGDAEVIEPAGVRAAVAAAARRALDIADEPEGGGDR